MIYPAPHGNKLRALLQNEKLPSGDRDRIERAISRYQTWRQTLINLPRGTSDVVKEAVRLLNEYRLFLDLDIVFDSENDFLYRQKGQLKLDNTVVEEFLPILVSIAFPDFPDTLALGMKSCFGAIYFTSTAGMISTSPKARIRTKDHDFTISRQMYLKASFDPHYAQGVDQLEASLAYLCAECKTNLDKTMFQEACATAHDVKTVVPGAKYLIICEWLDMIPVSTAGTDVDEVLILRKARRLGAQTRSLFASYAGRVAGRELYARYLNDNPFAADVFERFLTHVRLLLEDRSPDERDVLERGWF